MTHEKPDRPAGRRRIGLVLGAGGTLGATWMVGALGAVQERVGRPLGGVDVVVGTSAGSVLAAALRYGMTPEALVEHQRGAESPDMPDLDALERESGRVPALPRLRLGSPRLMARAIRSPHLVHPHVAMSAWAPRGRREHHALRRYLHRLVQTRGAHAHARSSPGSDTRWPERHTWIMAVDYGSGRRVAFGRPGAPSAALPDAVVASCSIPGWYAPKQIDGRLYVDSVALDSPHNYDPFFSRCVELGVAVTDHSTSLGWPERQSTTNYVSNHMGHFAASQHFNCRGIFLGGVVPSFLAASAAARSSSCAAVR